MASFGDAVDRPHAERRPSVVSAPTATRCPKLRIISCPRMDCGILYAIATELNTVAMAYYVP